MSVIENAIRRLQAQSKARRPEGTSGLGHTDDSSPARAPAPERPPQISFNVAGLRAAGLLPPEEEELTLSRQYRQIKRPLIARAFGTTRIPQGFLVMIASAMTGEGKSFTSVNLALSLSLEKDLHVLLVDADVAKPNISRVLAATGAPGLLDALRDPQMDVERLVLQTDVPTLSFLPAGGFSMEANELLASRRMAQVAAALGKSDSQRIVVFDSPPLLQTNESHALAQVVGQIVVVVRAEYTSQPMLLNALETLKDYQSVSLVLNQSMQPSTSDYYYYGGSEGNPIESR